MIDTKRRWWETDSCLLHLLAMLFMLSDHAWSTLFPGQAWMTCIGRIAFPLFAFMIVEGYVHTRDFRRYLTRMLVFALISEIPFNLMYNGTLIYPYHQNVLWTFLIALVCMKTIDLAKSKGKLWLTVLTILCVGLVGMLLGFACFTDYYGTGVLTVLVFYLFRGRKWWCLLGQFAAMYWLNVEVLGGYYYDVTILGVHVELIQQSLALLALIPIWLYRGRQGYHSKGFQYGCYAFYPVHMLVLTAIGYLMAR